ncbi:ACT domain-containing protein [Kitasatospora sp. NPDC059722]|uniref:ACT domain-containing protein n=1 Tax=Kitasatospora sp. NPDC059722 TaxID=3346925 RepID=UPI0036AC14EF
MNAAVPQQLAVLPGEFIVEQHGPGAPVPGGDWLALVRAPEGLTVVRPADADADAGGEGDADADADAGGAGEGEGEGAERWAAFYGGQTAHGLDVPGMLAALLTPLAAAGIPVFTASTFHADLVLVPVARLAAATAALRAAGHVVGQPADGHRGTPEREAHRKKLSPGT